MNNLTALEIQFDWDSDGIHHCDRYFAPQVNLSRDKLPPTTLADKIAEKRMGKSPGEREYIECHAGEIVPQYQPELVVSVSEQQFRRDFFKTMRIEPRLGRFYPAGVLTGIPALHPRAPVQCVALKESILDFDLNHPLASYPLRFTLGSEVNVDGEARGKEVDWTQITHGPGMQARRDVVADFWADNPFQRGDESDDARFYAQARMVNHLDDVAIGVVRNLYAKLLAPGMRVLDLMSSWVSHLPDALSLAHLTGLGMNQAELDANLRLDARLVHDLNSTPRLPGDDAMFDAVICTASVEYLTRPREVFTDVARVLKPGGLFVHTFSNRWFPPKAIKIWGELHEFERLRLVLEYFLQTKCYTQLESFSMRNLPRPKHDKYYRQTQIADPIYAVWGRKSDSGRLLT